MDIRTAVDDNDRQAKDIRELIAEGVDLLIVAPNEATPITPGCGGGIQPGHSGDCSGP